MPPQPPETKTPCNYKSTHLGPLSRPYVPLDILRHNNRLPTDAERTEALEHLEHEQDVLYALEHLLEDPKSDTELKKLVREERGALLKRIEHRQSWIAPVRRLPAEILETIFYRACFEENPFGYALSCQGTKQVVRVGPALKMGLVCHRWRVIAHSSPRLWASMYVNITDVTSQVREMVDFYLLNSVQCPLERLAIVDSEHGVDTSDIGVEVVEEHLGALLDGAHVLQTLLRHMDRAKEVLLRIRPVVLDVVHPPTLTFPNLLSFVDQSDGNAVAKYNSTLWRLIGKAPNLKSMDIEFMSCIHSVIVSFANLTSFTINDICTIEELLEILPRFTVLERLRVNHLEGCIYPLVPTDRITVTSLSNFHIETCAPVDRLSGILSFLTLPSLSELSVVSNHDDSDDSFRRTNRPPSWTSALTAMLERSKCPLVSLKLDIPYTSNLSTSTIPDLLSTFPDSLRSLDFRISGEALHTQESPGYAVGLFERLIPDPNNQKNIIVPRLTKLNIREPLIVKSGDPTTGVLNYAMESRSKERLKDLGLEGAVSALDMVTFEFVNNFTPDEDKDKDMVWDAEDSGVGKDLHDWIVGSESQEWMARQLETLDPNVKDYCCGAGEIDSDGSSSLECDVLEEGKGEV